MEQPFCLPYNFVGLPEEVLDAEDLPDRRYFNPKRKTGVIHCTLTTLSPLYISGTNKGEFFHHSNPNEPVIPGSSLRGMIRSIVQVITWSKMQPVTKKQMFLRDINNREDYMDFFGENIRAGFLRKRPGGYELEPCAYYKVAHKLMLENVPGIDSELKAEVAKWRDRGQPLSDDLTNKILQWRTGTNELPVYFEKQRTKWLQSKVKRTYFSGSLYPDWSKQNKSVWIQFDTKGNATAFNLARPQDAENWTEGILMLTGWMDAKQHEYVFVQNQNPEPITDTYITELVQDLESDDQISDWQKAAFSVDKPRPKARRKKGAIRDGEPVFYILERDEVKFLGRARFFRLPYGKPPYELLPEKHRSSTHIDMTEAIFGFVEKDKPGKNPKSYAVKGRVSFSDAEYHAQEGVPLWLRDEAFPPLFLAAPKPASYATYLQQPENLPARDVAHKHEYVAALKKYSSADAQLRGQKFYWHHVKKEHGQPVPLEFEDLVLGEGRDFEQRVKPLAVGNKFTFTVRFDSLTDKELGALLWALTLPGTEHMTCAHKLGMGKAIGMGSAQIEVTSLKLLDLQARYESFSSFGYSEGTPSDYINSFCNSMQNWLGIEKFGAHPRIRDLRMILSRAGMQHDGISYQGFTAYQNKPILASVESVYKAHHIPPINTADETPQPAQAQPGPEGTLIRGVVAETPSPNGPITFFVDDTEDLAIIEPEHAMGKQNRYKVDQRIKALCLRVEIDPAGDTIYFCTLNYPEDLK